MRVQDVLDLLKRTIEANDRALEVLEVDQVRRDGARAHFLSYKDKPAVSAHEIARANDALTSFLRILLGRIEHPGGIPLGDDDKTPVTELPGLRGTPE